ncbi:MAG: Ig-like domain-containing protein, partial [Propionicimonas sp.]|nr:Ig-like domain-containing protein [Propionicimonas sp.]
VLDSATALTNPSGRYTAASWAKLQAELAGARLVLADDSATQAQVDAAVTGLTSAVAGLVPNATGGQPQVVVTKVKLNQSQLRLVKGKSLKLEEGVYYKNLHSSYAGQVKWTSSNTRVATVSSNGTVKAKKTGTVTITATSLQPGANGKKLSAAIKVTVVKSKPKAKVTKVSASVPRTMTRGQSVFITGKYSSSKATGVKVTYKSSKLTVASVDQAGRVLAKAKGTATITVKAGGRTRSYKVTVK